MVRCVRRAAQRTVQLGGSVLEMMTYAIGGAATSENNQSVIGWRTNPSLHKEQTHYKAESGAFVEILSFGGAISRPSLSNLSNSLESDVYMVHSKKR